MNDIELLDREPEARQEPCRAPGEAEVWLSVVGYEGLYSVSSLGRIRSEPRRVARSSGSYTAKAGIRRPATGKNMPYPSLVLTAADGAKRTRYVHHLVLEAFEGPRPTGADACHSDGDCTNNRASNLRWDTRTANHADKKRHGTTSAGERHHGAKLSDELVRAMRKRRAEGASATVLSEEFGVSRMTAYRAATGKSWSHL